MKIKKIFLGSWFPKSDLHLDEIYDFLTSGLVISLLNKEKAKALRAKLRLQEVKYEDFQDIKAVVARAGEFNIRYFEDGLLVVEKSYVGLEKDLKELSDFYQNKLSVSFAYLFSKGAKGLEIIRSPGSQKKYFFVTQKATKREIENFCRMKNSSIETIGDDADFSIYRTAKFEIVNLKKQNTKVDLDNLIEYLILFSEIKKHLVNLMETHRIIWDQAESIVSKSHLRASELPNLSNVLTGYSNQVANIKTRIEQMRLNFVFREDKMNEDFLHHDLLLDFQSIKQNLVYFKNLFDMTQEQLKNNINNLTSVYQSTQRRALNRLQLLFLTSVVVSFVSLGAFPGADMVFWGPAGEIIASGKFLSFDLITMIRLGGIVLLVTIILYVIWEATFKKISTKIENK
jgi:hypothetical protein